ncbi:MAG: aspartate kinase, partial [Desulfobacteraceae bacterium]|nr:aspartate kinase [Desulfobacteraceae bacterium]
MKVIKIGGGCFKNEKAALEIIELIFKKGKGNIFVLSAFSGVTDILLSGITKALNDENKISHIINQLKRIHHSYIDHLISDKTENKKQKQQIAHIFKKLERFYFGINFTREATPRMRDIIACYGERLSSLIVASALLSRGINSNCIMPHKIGIITDGKFSYASAIISKTSKNLTSFFKKHWAKDKMFFIPGFYGVSETNEITTFGRGGSDYSAAVVAAAIKADILEIWKDTEGFMTADPDNIKNPKLIPKLSYVEAAELAYTGAGILHPRTVEPVKKAKINIAIKNTYNPDAPGSLITNRGFSSNSIIKSVSYTKNIAVLRIHASGVGARPGILSQITEKLFANGVNIKSVITSQTCISLLLSENDIDKSQNIIQAIKPKPYRRSEKSIDVALISIVGDGILRHKGIAAKCFTATYDVDVNIQMISFGTSDAALYFIVDENDLDKTIKA